MKPTSSYFNNIMSHYDSNTCMMVYTYECGMCKNQIVTSSGIPRSCAVCDIKYEKVRAKCVRRLFLSTL